MATKSKWLQEVEDDANRITAERIKNFKEEMAIKKAKVEKELANQEIKDAMDKKASK